MKEKKAPPDRAKLINSLIKEFEIKTPTGTITMSTADRGTDSEIKSVLSTGSTMLDLALRGGVPVGRVIEIFGKEGSGKSTLATHLMISCQKAGGVCILLDTEHTFSKLRARAMGLNTEAVLMPLGIDTVEKGFNCLFATIAKVRDAMPDDVPIVFVWDTIAASPIETNEKAGLTFKARVIQENMRNLVSQLTDKQVLAVFVNQIISGPTGDTTPGGNAFRFYASQRIQMWYKGKLEDTRGLYGSQSGVAVRKNKIDSVVGHMFENEEFEPNLLEGADDFFPFDNQVEISINFRDGIDDYTSMTEFLAKKGSEIVKKSGAWYKFSYNGSEFSCYARDIKEKVAEVPGLKTALRLETVNKFAAKF